MATIIGIGGSKRKISGDGGHDATKLDVNLSNIDENGVAVINNLIDVKLGPLDTNLQNILGDE